MALKSCFGDASPSCLQKPSASSETKDHNECLSRRLVLWREGRIAELDAEANTIQQQFVAQTQRKSHSSTPRHRLASWPSELVSAVRLRAAFRAAVTETGPGTPLKLECSLSLASSLPLLLGVFVMSYWRNILLPILLQHTQFFHSVIPILHHQHPVLYDSIDGDAIRRAALRTEGASRSFRHRLLTVATLVLFVWWRFLRFMQRTGNLCAAALHWPSRSISDGCLHSKWPETPWISVLGFNRLGSVNLSGKSLGKPSCKS